MKDEPKIKGTIDRRGLRAQRQRGADRQQGAAPQRLLQQRRAVIALGVAAGGQEGGNGQGIHPLKKPGAENAEP